MITNIKNILFTTSLLLATASLASDDSGLHVHDPWIREAPPNTRILAAYMTIENHDRKKHIITKITSPDFDRIEIHVSKMKDGVMVMENRVRLVVHPGKRFILQPGDYHLMLFGPKKSLAHGDHAQLVFHLEGGDTIMEKAKVKRVLGSFGKKH